jgi:uncharacterized protein (TIGR03437 family)
LGSVPLAGSAGKATATLTVQGTQLTQGNATMTAIYSGSSSNVSAPVTVSVQSGTSSDPFPAVTGLSNAASFTAAFAPGEIMAITGTNLAPSAASAPTIPLPILLSGVAATINGVAAPLYFVSPTVMNIQIPYETAAGTAILAINNNGKVVSQTITVSAIAPGIFMDQNRAPIPNTSAAPGQVVSLYVTGAGAMSPAIATGAAPALSVAVTDLPKPAQPTSVKVGGQTATIQFIGIPWNLAGVLLINYQVPAGLSAGVQPVTVTIGSATSPAVNLTITK